MIKLDSKILIRLAIMSIITTCMIPAFADNETRCNNTNITNCYLALIYQQNQILIQEQNKTNQLLEQHIKEGAIVACTDYRGQYFFSTMSGFNQDIDWWHAYGGANANCYNKVLEFIK
jgi:competence protein ComGC